jgi:hypothetical protein
LKYDGKTVEKQLKYHGNTMEIKLAARGEIGFANRLRLDALG